MCGSCLKLYCRLAENGFLVQNRRSQIAKSQIDCMENRMRIFSHLVFLITFPKNYRLQLKLAVSTRLDVD
jgi:hypothetical protein